MKNAEARVNSVAREAPAVVGASFRLVFFHWPIELGFLHSCNANNSTPRDKNTLKAVIVLGSLTELCVKAPEYC
jgi:hypothetical protein